MLAMILAGWVMQGLITIEEAEYIRAWLGPKPLPHDIGDVVRDINNALEVYHAKNK